MRKAKTTMAVIALAVLPLQAGAQAVDPSCHQVTLDRINAQKKEAGCPGFEGCDVLERYSALSARTVKEMEASNARYQQVWQAVANEKAGELAAFQQQADDIKRRDQTLDITNKAEVRRLQDDKEAYNTQVGIATMKLVAPDRRFDEVNAANTRIQTTSNDVESQELVGRLAVGLPERVALQSRTLPPIRRLRDCKSIRLWRTKCCAHRLIPKH